MSDAGREKGVALVIVLAFIVLLTGLVVAYFSRSMVDRQLSNSSFNQTKADELARSALDIITGDLKQELVSSGTAITSGSVTIYENTEIMPVRNGVPAQVSGTYPLPTLLRTSTTSGTTGLVDHLASNALSTGTSANGRSVTLPRWNQHYLLPINPNNTSPTDTTPSPSFTAPSWVYVTGTGGPANPPLAAPTGGVIGRYAYAIYDEGALLDANVAGYPDMSSPYVSGSSMPSSYSGKGALAFADLTQLTGTSGSPLLTGAAINNLVGWRNYASMQAQGAFPSLTFGVSGSALWTNYRNLIQTNSNGFVTTSGSVAGGMTDQAFLTRQELINLCLASGTANFNPQALQYLGTFSRAVNAPSWRPTATTGTPAGNTIDYAGQADNSTSANRNLPNVRFPNAATITHYSDGIVSGSGTMISPPTSSTYNVNAGDPLMQARFSLAKIAWLSQADPNTGNGPSSSSTYGKAIQSCFGLQWKVVGSANGGNACWSYVGSPDSSGVAHFNGTIETLDQVAAEGREPNFFEMLKAAILLGSLGQNPGPCAFNNGVGWPNSPYTGVPYNGSGTGTGYFDVYYTHLLQVGYGSGGGGFYSYSFDRTTTGAIPAPARISDLQIIQIGANIIDQYDADSWPTAICFQYKYPSSSTQIGPPYHATTDIYGPVDVVFGEENLPLLQGVYCVGATTDGQPQGDLGSNGLGGWLQPQLWNPHQMPAASSGVAPPQQFVIKGLGQTHLTWTANSGATVKDTGYTSNTLDGESIAFTDSNPLASAFYANPLVLTEGMTTISVTPSQAEMKSSTYQNLFERAQNPFVGFWMGTDVTYRNPTVHPNAALGLGNYYMENDPSGVVTFWLGWVDSGGGFHPYSCLAGVFGYAYWNPPQLAGSAQAGDCHRYADSRTQRFSHLQTWGFPHNLTSPYPNDLSSTFYPYNITRGQDKGPSDAAGWGAPGAREGGPSPRVFTWDTSGPYGKSIYGLYDVDWEVNSPSPPNSTLASVTYYTDPDGVIRPGDGVFGTPATGDGMMLFTSNGAPTGSPKATGDSGNTQHGRRPVVLNRPFRSVGELGYAFRDLPFKTLDFFTTSSADTGLLDLFSVSDQPVISAGQVNLSDAPTPVIQAILAGGSKKNLDATYNLTALLSGTIAQNITAALSAAPLANRADLVTRLGSDPATGNGPIRNAFTSFTSSPDKGNKAYLEAPVRALADVTNTRTWNLLIDVVAQTGMFAPNAPQTSPALNSSFNVQGERRYWLHIAIDRFTGKIIDQQLEPVYE